MNVPLSWHNLNLNLFVMSLITITQSFNDRRTGIFYRCVFLQNKCFIEDKTIGKFIIFYMNLIFALGYGFFHIILY